jgi:hypothetical protein
VSLFSSRTILGLVTREASTTIHGIIETIVEHENETIDLSTPTPRTINLVTPLQSSNTIDLCTPTDSAAAAVATSPRPHLAPQ